jgi:hypothetical protein
MTVPFHKRVSARDDVLCRPLDGEAVLLNLETEQYYGLDETAAHMFSVLTSSPTVRTGCETLSRAYDVDSEVLHRDVRRFIGDLLSCGLIDVHER